MNGMLIDLLGLNKFKLAIKKIDWELRGLIFLGLVILLVLITTMSPSNDITTIENKRRNVFSYLFKQYIIQQETSCS